MKKLSQEEFISRAKEIHGDKYDYSKTVYKNRRTAVCVTCPKHGDFYTKELLYGKGCIKCGFESTRSKRINRPSFANRTVKFGFGINDFPLLVAGREDGVLQSYQIWVSMLNRCYDTKYHDREPAYIGCSVCEDWRYFSRFDDWVRSERSGYKKGYQLDKDILVKGNKIYSPETCVFVPHEINSLFCTTRARRSELPIGVSRLKDKYTAHCSVGGKTKHLGSFSTPTEAFDAYKRFKEMRIKKMAIEYYQKGSISKAVYDAMMRYEVNISD